MSSVFDRLQYNFDDPDGKIEPYTNDVMKQLESMPPLLTDWQYNDIAEANTAGYYTNPVSNTTTEIINYCTTISSDAYGVVALSQVLSYSNNIYQISGPDFLAHTNRLSGVSAYTPATATKPHLETAMGKGTAVAYFCYQSGGVQNTSPVLGSFTSVLIKDTLREKKDQLQIYQQQVSNSIQGILIKTTTLTASQISTIESFLLDLKNLLINRKTHDENFFTQVGNVLDDYKNVRNFNNMGQSKTLVVNEVASDKLKSRLNST